MTTTKTLLLLRQTLARARVAVELSKDAAWDYSLNKLHTRCLDLLPDMERAIIEADREIERLEQDKWISVTERLPKNNEAVLATDGRIVLVAEVISMFDQLRWSAVGVSGYDFDWLFDGYTESGSMKSPITHWMPLPKTP